MAITNLTKYQWSADSESLTYNSAGEFEVDFTRDGVEYSSLTVTSVGLKFDDELVAGEEEVPQLDTPTNLSADGTIISFDPVENATRYEIFADDESIGIYTPATA